MHTAAGLSGGGQRAGGGEIRSLTGLRGVAAALVMLYHARPASDVVPVEQAFRHGYLLVDLFFVLSGFVIALGHRDMARGFSWPASRDFVGRRLARIYPLYIASTVLCLAVFAARFLRGFEDQLWQPPLLLAEAANALMIQSWGLAGSFNGAAWSISTEWMAYLLFPVLCLAVLGRGRGACVGVAAVAVAVLAALCLWPDAPAWHDTVPRLGPLDRMSQTSAAPLLRCVAEFCLGMAALRVHVAPPQWLDRHRGGIALAALAGIVVLSAVPGSDCAVVLLMVPLVFGACGRGIVRGVLSLPPLHWFGRRSYSFYMLHVLVLDGWGSVAAALHEAGLASGFVPVFATSFAVTTALSAATFRFVERPSTTGLRALLSRGARARRPGAGRPPRAAGAAGPPS
ncbi:MAG: acyltransferase family protein [Janthinobacterium lividum]